MREIIEQWAAALRSGKYKQGRKVLRGKSGCFCALGVVCDVLYPDQWDIESKETHITAYRHMGTIDMLHTSMVEKVFGGPTKNPQGVFSVTPRISAFFGNRLQFTYAPYVEYLTYLNDTQEVPFPVLADIIELVEEENAWI